MPSSSRVLTQTSAREQIRERSFHERTGDRVGVELEWFTRPSHRPPHVDELQELLGPLEPLANGSVLTYEPGAQVEISSAPFGSLDEACRAVDSDARSVREVLAAHGHDTFAAGLDPARPHELRTQGARYVAMREYFDVYGPAAGRMMCASAAIHVNLDAGDDEEGRARWSAAHVLGPTLVAAFANSPVTEDGRNGSKSSRIAAWRTLDPSRTRPVGAGDPAGRWCEYALAARVMLLRDGDGFVPLAEELSFSDWIEHGHRDLFPDEDDLAYHLTTLFPPVRAHGHMEMRMIDMLPDAWWPAAVAVAWASVCDPQARDAAVRACAPAEGMWDIAARRGLEDPRLRGAANACFTAALEALERAGCHRWITDSVDRFADRFTRRGLTPADERLAELGLSAISEAI